jgi:dTDP-4-dehydrorhamnose 3,5-epimerase
MIFQPLLLEGTYLIDLEKNQDDRGFFSRLYCQNEFDNHGLFSKWAQINDSYSKKKGTMRGLHFQRPPHAEVKVVRCIKGAVWDVIVDLRYQSNTYGKWFGVELSEKNRKMMYVPQGFAHGFITLSDHSEIFYLVSDFYSQSSEGCLIWNDGDVGIDWPISPSIISAKDKMGYSLKDLAPIVLKE